jgi:farnesyl-diphosphate farnesyltransferase
VDDILYLNSYISFKFFKDITHTRMTNQLLSILSHPNEWNSLLKIKLYYSKYKPDPRSLNELSKTHEDREFCYAALSKVSRSFSVVIRLLPEELQDAVCVFYLVLRGLDSIEDDTSIGKETRIALLSDFHKFLEDPDWHISDVGSDENYKMLLEHFYKVIACYSQLDQKYQQVIQSICKEMGQGMIKYLDKEIEDTDEYNEYCYYVAGLVGEGLSELFVSSGKEDGLLMHSKDLQIAMGQFLQKTNIIRDIREDLDEGRSFWPRQIWGNYAASINDFKGSVSQRSLHGLNHMVTDALDLAPKCLEYLRIIRDPGVFQFCAIPQVMAIATLAEVFQNPEVFKQNVKIRKGLAATLFTSTVDFKSALSVFQDMTESIFDKISLNDPNIEMQVRNLQKILTVTESFTIYPNQWESSSGLVNSPEIDAHPVFNMK